MTEQPLKGDFDMAYVLVSNNRMMGTLSLQDTAFKLFDSSALKVLEESRNLVHTGYKLVNHPLYGNFRPYQQPYRTIILQKTDKKIHAQHTGLSLEPSMIEPSFACSGEFIDMSSLHLIEEALLIFQNTKILTLAETPKSMLLDCAMLDFELLRFSLEAIGWHGNAPKIETTLFLHA